MLPPDGNEVRWLQLKATDDSIEEFRSFILSQAESAGLPEDRFPILELAVEELLVNVVSYAYNGRPGWIRVGCGTAPGRFQLWIEDQGKAFNPLDRTAPDISEGIQERRVGGLGIHLVRTMVDAISYSRQSDSNLLQIQFNL